MTNREKTTTISVVEVNLAEKTADQALAEACERLDKIDVDIFNVALLVAYAAGIEIPAYIDTQGNMVSVSVTETKKDKQSIAEQIDRSPQMVTEHIRAIEYIIARGAFARFAAGKLQYQSGKLYLASRVDGFNAWTVDEVLNTSVTKLREAAHKFVSPARPAPTEQAKAPTTEQAKAPTTEQAKAPTTEQAKAPTTEQDTVSITLDGVTYTVPKAELIEFCKVYGVVAK